MSMSLNMPVICPLLIGRQLEITTLHALADQTGSRRGQLVLISGEAGIGKSRLVAETHTYTTEQGFLQIQGNCFPTDRSSPYAPLLDLLRSSPARETLATYTANLEPIARDLTLLDLETGSLPARGSSSLEPEKEKRRLFEALTRFFTTLAAKQPVLITIEDIHWSDESSLEFLYYLARRCTAHPLLILATFRSDEAHLVLRHWLAQLDRERLAQEIVLHSLTRTDIEAMLQAIFGQYHLPPLRFALCMESSLRPSPHLQRVIPFSSRKCSSPSSRLVDISYTDGSWERKPRHELHIPRSIQDAVHRRVAQLSESARQLLTLATIAGRRFDFTFCRR